MVIIKDNLKKVNILEVCDIQVGKTPSRDNKSYWGEGYPWLSIRDMNGKRILMNTNEAITQKAVNDCRCRIVPKNTVVYSFKLSIGKVGITGVPMYTNEAIAAFIIKDDSVLDTNYLAYVLKATDFSGGSNKAVMGKTLNKKLLEKFVIPLPSLAVQREIAKELDHVNTLIAKRERTIHLIDGYLVGILNESVKSSNEIRIFEIQDIVNNPKYDIKAGPFGSSLKKECYKPFGYKIYGQEQVIKDDLKFGNYYIDEDKYKELERYKVCSGDVLISLVGTFGKVSVIPQNFDPGIINPRLMKISVNKNLINPFFLADYLKSDMAQSQIRGSSHGGTMGIVNVGIMKKIKVQVPNLVVQEKYLVARNSVLKMKNVFEKQLTELQMLFDSILKSEIL